jgi:hypothetical protein
MLNDLEAKVRVKINKLLEEAGWHFFDTPEGKANLCGAKTKKRWFISSYSALLSLTIFNNLK